MLEECTNCGSMDFCIEEEESTLWVKCRQCDKTYGEVIQK